MKQPISMAVFVATRQKDKKKTRQKVRTSFPEAIAFISYVKKKYSKKLRFRSFEIISKINGILNFKADFSELGNVQNNNIIQYKYAPSF